MISFEVLFKIVQVVVALGNRARRACQDGNDEVLIWFVDQLFQMLSIIHLGNVLAFISNFFYLEMVEHSVSKHIFFRTASVEALKREITELK